MTGEIVARRVADILDNRELVEREIAAARVTNRAVGILSEAFRAAGISQRELAKELEVSPGRVSQVLSGEGNVYLTTLARYLRALGYHLELGASPAEPGRPAIGHRTRRVARRNRRAGETSPAQMYSRNVHTAGGVGTELLFTDGHAPGDVVVGNKWQFEGYISSPETKASRRSVTLVGKEKM